MGRPRARVCLQDGLKLDLNRLRRQGLISTGGRRGPITVQWNSSYWGLIAEGSITSDVSEATEGWLRIELPNASQTVDLVSRPRHLGGRQWYFRCPATNRDVSVLWRPPGARRFCSRQTWKHQVAYKSQFLDNVDRAHHAQAKIKARLIDNLDPEVWDLPPRPKRMRSKTYERWTEKFDHYDSVLNYGIAALVEKLGKNYR